MRLRLLVASLLALVSFAAFGSDKCTLSTWDLPKLVTVGSKFGPDNKSQLFTEHALILRVPNGMSALLTFWSHCSGPETAMIVYEMTDPKNVKEIAKRKMVPNPNWDDLSISGPKTILITGWHKPNYVDPWIYDFIQSESYPGIPGLWIAGVGNEKRSGYREMVSMINCSRSH